MDTEATADDTLSSTSEAPLKERYRVPSEAAFGEGEFMEANDIAKMVPGLIDKHSALFGHITNVDIICLWKKSGGQTKGKPTWAKVQSPSGLLRYFAECDFVVWLAADHLREKGVSAKEVEAIIFHELCHLQWDAEDGKIMVVGHDFEGFAEEIKHYGMWRRDLAKAGEAIRQLSLL